MRRRHFWGRALGFLILAQIPTGVSAAAIAAPLERGTNRINILFLMDDQHRGDWLGAAGAKWMITPNLDRLAREGVLFRRAYSSVPSCLGARAAVLTGMSPWGHGCLGYTPMPARYQSEGPRIFTEAGYRTCAIGKQHFSPPRNSHGYETVILGEPNINDNKSDCDYYAWFTNQAPGQHVFERFRTGNDQRGGIHYPFKEELHEAAWTADQAVAFLSGQQGGSPWLLKVSFHSPHAPLNAPERWYKRYEGVDIPGPITSEWSRRWYGGIQTSFQQNPDASRGVVPEEELRQTRRSYAANISWVDEQIGRIVSALEKRGELENTLILFTSDHGDVMGDHYLYRKTFSVEGSVRVPMIVRWPARLRLDAPRGQVRSELAELRDVLPTFLDAAGLVVPKSVEGASLLEVLRGKPWREILDLEHASCYAPKDGWVGLMDRRYKYVYYTCTGRQQLFDLERDPQEVTDLAGDPASSELTRRWRAKMAGHLAMRGDSWVNEGELVVQAKAQLRRANNPNVAP